MDAEFPVGCFDFIFFLSLDCDGRSFYAGVILFPSLFFLSFIAVCFEMELV